MCRLYLPHIINTTASMPNSVMVNIPASSEVDNEFESRSGQTKEYKIIIYVLSTEHVALRSMNKYWLSQNHDNVSEWSNKSIVYRWTVVTVR